jgi:DNA repair protein RadD
VSDLGPRTLFPDQQRALNLLRDSVRSGHRRPVLQAPTGFGKTVVASQIVRNALAKENRVAFVVPAIELIDQSVASFELDGVARIGVIQADHPRRDLRAPVQVCSVDTLDRRGWPEVNLALIDECHRASALVERWKEERPETLFLGLSATPWRKGMAEEWDDLLQPVSLSELIDLGRLSDFRTFAPAVPDLSAVKTVAGDFHQGQASTVMSDSKLVGDVVQTWLKLADNRPTIVFAVDRAHAHKLQEQFEKAGIEAGYMDAFTPSVERKLIARRFRLGHLRVVCNVGVLTTGVDWDVRCIVFARPTKSDMLWCQMFGRGLRTAPGKDYCLILDHSGNSIRLGLPTDISYPMLRTGNTKDRERAAEEEPEVKLPKLCSQCAFCKPPGVIECPQCGFKPKRQPTVKAAEGDLVEFRPRKAGVKVDLQPTRAEKQLFWSNALWLAAKRNKTPSFAKALYREKFGVWPTGLDYRPERPGQAFFNYEQSRRIAFAKGKEKERKAHAQP